MLIIHQRQIIQTRKSCDFTSRNTLTHTFSSPIVFFVVANLCFCVPPHRHSISAFIIARKKRRRKMCVCVFHVTRFQILCSIICASCLCICIYMFFIVIVYFSLFIYINFLLSFIRRLFSLLTLYLSGSRPKRGNR